MFLKTGSVVKHPLAASQYTYREVRSTETGLRHLGSRVERQLQAEGYATGAFLDSTSSTTIKQVMIRHEIPKALMDWAQDMLVGRNLIVHNGDTTIEGKPDRGCPQAGVFPHFCSASCTSYCIYKKNSFPRLWLCG
jgi:hypothetical protein